MAEITSEELAELRRVGNRLLDIVDKLTDAPVEVSQSIREEVRSKLERRICLACGAKIPARVRIKRGQEESCYNTTRRRIRRGEVRERELIEQGRLTAESAPPGRPAKQDLHLTESEARRVADDLADYEKKRKSGG